MCNGGRESAAIMRRERCRTTAMQAKKCPDAFRVVGTERPCKAEGTRKSSHYTNVRMLSIGDSRQVAGLFRQFAGVTDPPTTTALLRGIAIGSEFPGCRRARDVTSLSSIAPCSASSMK